MPKCVYVTRPYYGKDAYATKKWPWGHGAYVGSVEASNTLENFLEKFGKRERFNAFMEALCWLDDSRYPAWQYSVDWQALYAFHQFRKTNKEECARAIEKAKSAKEFVLLAGFRREGGSL